jgi:TPR repeat protein
VRRLVIIPVLFGFLWAAASPSISCAQISPIVAHECEAGKCDGTWTINGKEGKAEWASGARGILNVARFDAEKVVIIRKDSEGISPGLSGIYTGTLTGNRAQGEVKWFWPGHYPQPRVGKWSLTIDQPVSHTTTSTQNPPAPVTASSSTPSGELRQTSGIDLNGTWEANYGTPGSDDYRVEKVFVYQLRNVIQIKNVEGRQFIRPGDRFVTAVAAGPLSAGAPIPVDVKAPQNGGSGKLVWLRSSMSLDDQNHFRIAETQKFQRTSTAHVRDVACEDSNAQHVSGEDAFFRGNVYYELKDLVTANCWYHVGANEGFALAQSSYAYSLLNGRGIKADPEAAKRWAQKSADQHDAYGEANLVEIYKRVGFAMGLGQAQEYYKRYQQHNPDMAYTGDPTAPRATTIPAFVKDQSFTYDLAGEWKLIYPENAARHPSIQIDVLLKDGNFQMIVGNPNIFYPMGESMFNGKYSDNRIVGDLMDAPAHHSDSGYRGYAWTKAEVQIIDADNLMLPGNVKMKRTSSEMGANKVCDAAKYATLDAGHTLIYANKDYELGNYGNAACWMYVSASQGNAEAQLNMGLLLHFGAGVKKDYEQSFNWFRKAADADNFDGERALAHCYEFGVGVKKNPALAKLWTTRVNGQIAQAKKEAMEEAKMRRNLAIWGALLTGFKSDHELNVEKYEGRGMSHGRAEKAARSDEAEDQFFQDMIHGYQPPPMPPAHH